MRKLSTREPCSGEPHAWFGGRGVLLLYPYPICKFIAKKWNLKPELCSRITENSGKCETIKL